MSDIDCVEQRIVENFRLILVGINDDFAQLRNIINHVDVVMELDECLQLLHAVDNEKVFLITSETLSQCLVRDIHDMSQLDTVYILGTDQSSYKLWAKEWIKVKGLYSELSDLYNILKSDIKQCNQDLITISLIKINEDETDHNLNELESCFIYAEILKQILPEIEDGENSIKNLANYCRQFYNGNTKELNFIDDFELDYCPETAIQWYLRECFLFQMLNRAFHTMEIDTLIHFSFYIRDLNKQLNNNHEKSDIVYHGQGLSTLDFEKLMNTKTGIISFHTFLLACKRQTDTLNCAKAASTKTDTVGVHFYISVTSTFTKMMQYSYVKNEEAILFSVHSLFHIQNIRKIDDTNALYQVDLTLVADDNPQLQMITEHIRDQTVDYTSWERLGHFFIQFSEFDKAEVLYNVLLKQTFDTSAKALYYNKLGYINDQQGLYEEALLQYQNALEIQLDGLPENHLTLAYSYNSIGEVYRNIGIYSTALYYYEKAHAILEAKLSSHHPDLATSYNNIGLVYKKMGELLKVLPYYEKAFDIYQETLPASHPLLATALNNIAGIYVDMQEYEKALSLHEKALQIYETTLPDNHRLLATSNNNIGLVYYNLKQYSTALLFYEKALAIRLDTLPPNHPSLATSYNNIAWVFKSIGDAVKALTFFERALRVLQRSLPSDHSHIQSVQQSIHDIQKEVDKTS